MFYQSIGQREGLIVQSVEKGTTHDASKGITLELCAGIVDKDKDTAVTAKAEVHEETGYDAPLSAFEKVTLSGFEKVTQSSFEQITLSEFKKARLSVFGKVTL